MASAPVQFQAERQRYLQRMEDARRAGQIDLAFRIADEAVSKGYEDGALLSHAAYHRLNFGDVQGALALAERAKKAAPRDVNALNVLGLCLQKLARHEEAIAAFNAAIRISPTAVAPHFNKACSLEETKELSAARAEFERTIALEPAHPDALAHLASLTAQRGAMQKAREYGERALRFNPNQPIATLAVAVADVEDRQYEAAQRRLVPVFRNPELSVLGRALANGLMGDTFDGLGKIDEAFAAYSASAAIFNSLYRQKAESDETGWERVRRLAGFFRALSDDEWRAPDDGGESPVGTHIFLVGFPRSGTTLLENVLGSHPDIETMEEIECLNETAADFIRPREGLRRLAAMSAGELEPYRKDYWRRVSETGLDLKKPIFIDKMPFYSIVQGAIAKLFPRAKILFALRDPRDVVLSCFRRRLSMYEMTTLEGVARYYDGVMTLSDVFRGKLALPVFDLRYESVVADFEGELRKVCEFLGVEWDEKMRDFTARAARRPINTPSAAQISRGLYSQGVAHWRKYEKHLAPVLPMLDPWVKRFGYPES
ncbi:MAG TPA: sulfotransferase [Rhizomicrobium sp.]|nr:sulfotransferase [Rhizomicrobium sp.]